MAKQIPLLACLLTLAPVFSFAQSSTPSTKDANADLRFVVYISRHGVRSPTGKAAQYDIYSAAPWPKWDVEPGYLTPHGFHLMQLFGAYDRMEFAREGLLHADGCADATSIAIYADSDQRTRETGKALAQGLFPNCNVPVHSLPEGTHDPLFHPIPAGAGHPDSALAIAAIAGRIGNSATNLTLAYHTQIATLDKLLATCGATPSSQPMRTSLFNIPATLLPGTGDHLADLKGPINTASTLSENLLLEYTEGMEAANVGWGCVDLPKLRSLMDIHAAATDFTQRTPVIAAAQASNLLEHIDRALRQAVTEKPIAGAIATPKDRALILVGHDTNLENIAGMLGLTWVVDGRRDDTPPGGALIFELWRQRKTANYSVRAYFTAQTLDQMRQSTPLTLVNSPERIPLFIPGCSREDFSCTWLSFSATLQHGIRPLDVVSK